jgi:hypothetical protein
MPTSHQEVLRSFVEQGRSLRGARVFADADEGAVYSHGHHFPLVVRLRDGFVVNGRHVSVSTTRHQNGALRALDEARAPYAVIPFDALGAALFGGADRSPWSQPWHHASPSREAVDEIRKHVSIAVPTNGERWRQVQYRKADGTEATRWVHTLGDSVIVVRDHYYISAVDDTGVGRGLYFLTELRIRQTPGSLREALESLKPDLVRQAERDGTEVRRQGEWFAIRRRVATGQLLRDVRRGMAIRSPGHVLGRSGHHRLTLAVIYKRGPQKGEVYARGTMRHTAGEHRMLSLPNWYRVVHSIQGQSYSLGGRGVQFD